LGKPATRFVRRGPTHSLHRFDHLRCIGDHVIVQHATEARLEHAHFDPKTFGPPPRLKAVLRGPELPQLLGERSIRPFNDDLPPWPNGRCKLALVAHVRFSSSRRWTTLRLALERGSETVETRFPEGAILCEPPVELAERLRPQRVEAPLSIGSHRDEPCVVENPQVA